MTPTIKTTIEKEALNFLHQFIAWWDVWNNSTEPHNIYDPPINEARLFLENQGLSCSKEENLKEFVTYNSN